MLDIPNRPRQERIDAIVRAFVKAGPAGRVISPDDNLEDMGLTSLDMVNLMLAVEAEFDLMIPGMKLIPANFRSIASIDGLVSELTH